MALVRSESGRIAFERARSPVRRVRISAAALVATALLVLSSTACLPAARPSLPDSSAASAGLSLAAQRSPSPGGHPHDARRTAAAPAASTTAGRLLMPVHGVRVGAVTSNFGAPRGGRTHEGIDIHAPVGTPVYSAGHGYVHFLGTTALGGWTVWVKDGDRDFWYAHLASIAPGLAKSAAVTPHTLLGYVGNSGNAAGGPPHLHFEVVTAGVPIDPLPLLQDRF